MNNVILIFCVEFQKLFKVLNLIKTKNTIMNRCSQMVTELAEYETETAEHSQEEGIYLA